MISKHIFVDNILKRDSAHFFSVKWLHLFLCANKSFIGNRDARGVMVIVVGNGHGDTSSNPGPG